MKETVRGGADLPSRTFAPFMHLISQTLVCLFNAVISLLTGGHVR